MATSGRDPRPSTYNQDYWIFARNKTTMNNRDGDENVGKWMIFKSYAEIDDTWDTIRKATEEGKLGFGSKVSTRKDNGLGDGTRAVICIYTYDWTDEEDVMRVRQALRDLGFDEKLPYKSDADTLAGKYRHTGHKRVSKYYC